ncbi:MAG: cell division protein ZapA [Ruminococcaceae bacterium]|nr:cell division protein ZapA [Oscillospiraceae bacterium]
MNEKQKLEVRICGRDYTLVSEESPEYIHRVAFYVDQKMREVEQANPRLSISMAAVLTSLNIGDEFLKGREETSRLKEETVTKDETLYLANKKIEELEQQITELQNKYQALQIRYAKKETELEDALKSFELGLQNNNITFDDLT